MNTYNDVRIQPLRTRRDDLAARSLAQAIATSRKGIGAPLREQRHGRLDRKRIARLATGNLNVFTRPAGIRPNRIRATILIDASGSMTDPISMRDYTPRMDMAAQVARDLAEAISTIAYVTADMLAFTTGNDEVAQRDAVIVTPVWSSGEPTSNVDDLGNVPMGGTEEGYALAITADEIIAPALRPNEQALIVMISDGDAGEVGHTMSVVADLADNGIPVVCVALTSDHIATQRRMYGDDNVIEYSGSAIALGYEMARVIGRVL